MCKKLNNKRNKIAILVVYRGKSKGVGIHIQDNFFLLARFFDPYHSNLHLSQFFLLLRKYVLSQKKMLKNK